MLHQYLKIRIALLAIYKNMKCLFWYVTALPNPFPTTQCHGGPNVLSIYVLISILINENFSRFRHVGITHFLGCL